MRKCIVSFFVVFLSVFGVEAQKNVSEHGLQFQDLPKRWDEALPLGNGMIGELIWQKDQKLRLSLDHAELWDLRPMKGLHQPGFTYQWVKEQVLKGDYSPVQKQGDEPYEREPAPGKIPGAGLEFDISGWGKVLKSGLNIEKAVAVTEWENGIKMSSFVHASLPYGYFKFENIQSLTCNLIPPKYQGEIDRQAGGSVEGDDLSRLGYKQGKVIKTGNSLYYLQQGWGGFYYEVSVKWAKTSSSTIEGVWCIAAHYPESARPSAALLLKKSAAFSKAFVSHASWWRNFWAKSAISLPDSILERQWYLEQYKFGCTARKNAPPISLQAIWTADNGRLPPWKGDFHHDLNTQLSYWPGYASNHLEEGLGYLNHLDQNKARYKRYTKWFYGTDGLNVPGVTTLSGEEMGGWIQYSFSPTVSAWLSQHFYWQWRYSMDRVFLQKRAYPWFSEVTKHLEKITYLDKNGKRQLPLSSSPEINDNSASAWFQENTNYDLALMRYVFEKAAELAIELKLNKEAAHFKQILSEFPDYALSEHDELSFAPQMPYNVSHRHFSHAMAIHPLAEIRVENGEKDQKIIRNTIALLDKIGPAYWCGYSYAWLGNMKARAKDGAGASKALKDFATAFCSVNSFHLNGDQTRSGKSQFTYRPFTLEGNFAFASGIQEMLLQSYTGNIEIFPAIPSEWKELSFENLRAEGAFLVSAKRSGGLTDEVKIVSEKGGMVLLKSPFKTYFVRSLKSVKWKYLETGFFELRMEKGGQIVLKNGYE